MLRPWARIKGRLTDIDLERTYPLKQNQLYADLHIHSTYSDGLLTPLEIINTCIELQLKTIAITDHDSVTGIKEAIEADQNKIEIIPAVEMSSNIGDIDIHILGYYIDHENTDLLSYFADFKKHRLKRAKKIVEKLSRDGVKLDFNRISDITKNGSLGRPHIAGALLKNGYVNSINEAFIRYLGYHSPYYVPKKNIHPKEVIKKIKDWRGIPVVAHPGVIGDEDIINQLISKGALGIEVWHPEHSRKKQNRLFQIAIDNKLLMTGGSDFHGFRGKYNMIGKFGCGKEEVLKLKQIAHRR